MTNFDFSGLPDPQPIPPAPPVDPAIARAERIAADTRVESDLNRFIAAKQEVLFTAPDAFYRTQGEDAIHASPATTKRLGEIKDTLLDGLANDYQRKRLGHALDAQMTVTRGGMARHVAEQSLAWQRQIALDRIDLLAKEAALHHSDDDLIDGLGTAAANAARAYARVGDAPPLAEVEDNAAASARSRVLANAVQARLNSGNTEGAGKLYDRVQGQLDDAHAGNLGDQIQTQQRWEDARASVATLAPGAPATSYDEVDARYATASAQNLLDHAHAPELQSDIEHFLTIDRNLAKRTLNERNARQDQTIEDWVTTPGTDGQPQTDLPPLAVFGRLLPEKQTELLRRLQQNRPGAEVERVQHSPEPATPMNNPSERLPATTGRRGIAPNIEPPPGSPEYEAAMNVAVGRVVHLPNGSAIPDADSPTGQLMSPVSNLSDVAAAGRKAGAENRMLASDPATFEASVMLNGSRLGFALGHGGAFDYQRGPGNSVTGFEQRPQFRNVSNVNVGLFGQQAGLSLDHLLRIAGEFAALRSKNANDKEPYGLDPQTRRFIEAGYKIGETGMFDDSGPP